MNIHRTDYLIIGSGLAGLAFALKAASRGRVAIVTKADVQAANTLWAQGGIAAVIDKTDSFESHYNDTLRAGAGLCRPEVVRNFIEQAPDRIQDLTDWGVHFDLTHDKSTVDLTREGGHSARRILHFGDQTGAEIHRALLAQCQEHPRIEIHEQQFAIDLIFSKNLENTPTSLDPKACLGAYVLDRKSNDVCAYLAPETILATGGAGKVYLYTSNWSGATGDGIAIAYRAGARVANLEFMQFHPTCLYHKEARNFLISEALRGEGGELINAQGEAFVKKAHELGSLAPRDIVARAIDAEMKKSGAECVFLDMRHHPRSYLEKRFPVIFKTCLDFGIDMSQAPIPVVPAAHYLCGGVVTDEAGQTDLPHLWTLGESSCTGLHGANRLASNSLLECLSMAHNCWEKLQARSNPVSVDQLSVRQWLHPPSTDQDEMIVIHHMWDEIRTLMWNYVGIVRSNKRLERAAHRLQNLQAEVRDYYSEYRLHPDILELRNIAILADLTVKCALQRRESRGIHFNLDFPWATDEIPGRDSILMK